MGLEGGVVHPVQFALGQNGEELPAQVQGLRDGAALEGVLPDEKLLQSAAKGQILPVRLGELCLLYTSDAADD